MSDTGVMACLAELGHLSGEQILMIASVCLMTD
jgi:hypothetical protein